MSICIALYHEQLTSKALRFSGVARVNEGSHSFTCHAHVYPQVEWAIPAFTPQPQSITALWMVLISIPLRVEGWVGLSGWLQTGVVYPTADGHPSQY